MNASINALTEKIIAAAIEVHRQKGPGLLESAYEACLAHELTLRSIQVQRQVPVRLQYKGLFLDVAFRADLIVEDQVLIELKAVESLHEIHKAQLLSYLRETGHPIGLLINFHVPLLVKGVTRLINDRVTSAPSVSSVLKSDV